MRLTKNLKGIGICIAAARETGCYAYWLKRACVAVVYLIRDSNFKNRSDY
jgi:hypothetical protein